MSNHTYALIENTTPLEETVTYGLAVLWRGKTILQVPDVSLDRKAVIKLVKDCNRLRLCPVHLFEILEDFWGNILDF